MRQAGCTLAQIAVVFGVTESAVSRWLSRRSKVMGGGGLIMRDVVALFMATERLKLTPKMIVAETSGETTEVILGLQFIGGLRVFRSKKAMLEWLTLDCQGRHAEKDPTAVVWTGSRRFG